MLAEFMTFNDKKLPDPNEVYKPKVPTVSRAQPSAPPRAQRPKKQSIVMLDGIEELRQLEEETLKLIKEQEALSLAEQILRRQHEEQENKKREILKQLHKPKNVNLKKFLTRTVGYEQKKNFDLEQKRFKQLEEETKICKDRPLLSHKTAEMIKTMHKKPIYERTKEIIEKREKNLNELKNKDYNKLRSKKKKLNKSMDNINSEKENKGKNEEYIINERTKNKKMNASEMNDYYKRQNQWKDKLEKKNILKERNQKNKKEAEFDEFFHPKICPGTIEIINEKNKINEKKPYQIQNTDFSNNHYYYAKIGLNQKKLSLLKSVYDRLYEENALFEMKKSENKTKAACSFQPFTNKNKYKQIQSKYKDIKVKHKKNKRTRNAKNNLRGARSVEVDRKKDTIDTNDKKRMNASFDIGIKPKEKKINQPWSNVLLKLKNDNNDSDDISYRLNVRQGSAWNENDVNTVQYRGASKEIVKFFI
jgi:hypothetical protein